MAPLNHHAIPRWAWPAMLAGCIAAIIVAIGMIAALPRVRAHAEAQAREAARIRARITSAQPGIRAVITAADITIERSFDHLAFTLPAGASLDDRLNPGPWEAQCTVTFDPGRASDAAVGADFSGCSFILMHAGRVLLADASDGESRRRMTLEHVSFPGRSAVLVYRITSDGALPVSFRALWQPEDADAPVELP